MTGLYGSSQVLTFLAHHDLNKLLRSMDTINIILYELTSRYQYLKEILIAFLPPLPISILVLYMYIAFILSYVVHVF